MDRLQIALALVGLALFSAALVYFFVLAKGAPHGNWHGTFVTPSGKRGALHLEISRPRAKRVLFSGSAQSCIGSPLSEPYDLVGQMSGADSSITLSPRGMRTEGEPPIDLDVEWHDGGLTVTGLLRDDFAEIGVSDAINPDHSQPTTVHLEKGDDADYEDACRSLSG